LLEEHAANNEVAEAVQRLHALSFAA